MQTLVDRPCAAAPDEEIGGGVDIAQLRVQERNKRVASPERFRQGQSAARQPASVTGLGIVPALVDDLAGLETYRQRLSYRPVDLVRALGAACDVDDGRLRIQTKAPAGCLARPAGQLRTQRVAGQRGALSWELVADRREND